MLSRLVAADDGDAHTPLPQTKNYTDNNNNNSGNYRLPASQPSTSLAVISIIQLLWNQLLKVIKRFIKSVSITGSLTAADYNQ